MQFRNLFVAGMVLVAVAVQSCKKDEATANVKDTLTGSNWTVSSGTISPAIDVNNDGLVDSNPLGTVIDSCSIDDIFKFQANNVLVITEGAVSCSPGNSQATTSVWALNADESLISINGFPYTVKSHTSTSIVLSSSVLAFGTTVTLTFNKN